MVVDSPSSLTGRKTGDAEHSRGLHDFLMWQKQSQRAVLLVRQTNRKGRARGSTRSEDALDLVLALRRPADRRATDGLRVEIHVERARRLIGPALAPVRARTTPRSPRCPVARKLNRCCAAAPTGAPAGILGGEVPMASRRSRG
jgi:hypothetical protein